MATDQDLVFTELKAILAKYAGDFDVSDGKPGHYGLEAPPGPATLRSWHGQLRRRRIPVAWVQKGKSSVSFHLMPLQGMDLRVLSPVLEARRTGKTCLHFSDAEPAVLAELAKVTARGLAAFRAAGFIAGGESS